jgi:hypothetical protein
MKKMLVLFAIGLSFSACATTALPVGSVVLGERMVDFKMDQDVINVDKSEGLFRTLYFVVENNDLDFFNLLVAYGNGDREKVEIRHMFREGSRSRMVDLAGERRQISSIQFNYKTAGMASDGQSRIIVYGVR